MTTALQPPPEEESQLPPPLYDCQRRGLRFLESHPNAILAMAMGLGKTRCAIQRMKDLGKRHNLVLAPLCAVDDVWENEIGKYWGTDDAPHVINLGTGNRDHGGRGPGRHHERKVHKSAKEKARHGAMRLDRAPKKHQTVTLLNYESLLRPEVSEFVASVDWDVVVLDEIHRIKSPSGKLGKLAKEVSLRAPVRIGLTGTPMPQGPLDVYGQFEAIEPGIFGNSYNRFKTRYEAMSRGQARSYRNMDELMLKFREIAYEASIEELELPEYWKDVRWITISKEAKRAHDGLKRRLQASLESGERVTAAGILAALTRMRQVTSGYAAVDNDEYEPGLLTWKEIPRTKLRRIDRSKQDHLEEVLHDLPPEERVVVFCLFRHDLDDIAEAAAGAGRPSSEYSGERKELEQWRQTPGSVLAAQMQAGSVSVSLTEARYCVYYSLGYSVSDHMQSRARLHRGGQKRSQYYYYLCAKGTIDQTTARSLETGEDTVRRIMERREIQIPLL